jgi:5-methyltetrahydropteroyltriglutamate--homocysteine methyltransferase
MSHIELNYRADHIGSLLRPPELLRAREDRARGVLPASTLRKHEDDSILRALELQRQTGISVLSDGEYRRARFHEAWDNVLGQFLTTLPPGAGTNPWRGPHAEIAQAAANAVGAARHVVVNKIDVDGTGRLTAHEVDFLKQHSQGKPYKTTLPGPGYMLGTMFAGGPEGAGAYASREELAADLVAIARRELSTLVDEGVPYIQLDSLRYVLQLVDPRRRQALIDAGIDPERDLDLTIATDNACLDQIDRKGSVIGMHMCRGNNRSAWMAEGSYDAIAEKTFSQLHVDRLLLEYDDEQRDGGFEALRFVPHNTMVVLGLVSSKVAGLESIDTLRRRIDAAARYHPLGRLAISPQCGFASTAPGNMLTWDDQRRKLALVVETAHQVWGEEL